MAASFPTSIKTFSTKVDLVDSVLAADTNEQSDEITALETYLITTIAWANWTPTIAVSGGTAPTYTATFLNRYMQIRKLVVCHITWYNSSGGTAGAGANAITFTLPVTASSSYSAANSNFGMAYVYESGGTSALCWTASASTTTARFVLAGISSVVGNDQSSTDRRISSTFMYEAA